MTPAISGQQSYAARQYTAARSAARSEGSSSPSFQTTAPATASASPKARVTTRSIGLNLGKFGLSYTSSDVRIDPDELQSAVRSTAESGSYGTEAVIAAYKANVLDFGGVERPQPEYSTAFLRNRGIAAYQAMAGASGNDQIRRTIGVV